MLKENLGAARPELDAAPQLEWRARKRAVRLWQQPQAQPRDDNVDTCAKGRRG